ncbi:NUDIX hydrolase [Sulfurimonas sp.]|uniref:NUDIX hydrolase n=1 Tax=Sulfurimonas sp. TaxID=2022749 RepID=UPI002AAF7FDE|nr:NUDIX hydrolase [Sulfurimonas sp.]
MNKIDSITKLQNPKFVIPVKINYTQNGKKKEWESVKTIDCVSILIYHKTKKAFVLVKQLRIPVLHANEKDGMMYELCAGLIDKDTSIVQIAKEEILEECGYDIPVQNLQKITSFYTSVGISGTKQTLFYAECDETMKVNNGGGLEDEEIEVIYLPINKAKEFMFDEDKQKTPSMIMSFYWFFDNILTQ